MGEPLAGLVVAEAAVGVARAGLAEEVAALEAASWPQGPPVGVVRAGLVLAEAVVGVVEAEAEVLGQEAARVGVSPPATGVQVCHCCWYWGARGEGVALGLQMQWSRAAPLG